MVFVVVLPYYMPMQPSPAHFHAYLQQLAAQRADPTHGFFGPQTLVWQVNRERINYLGGLRAILMQLAHPAVAQGVADHSHFQQDPLGRFVRTMSVVQDILFGPADVAVKAATRVYVRHARVRGILVQPASFDCAGHEPVQESSSLPLHSGCCNEAHSEKQLHQEYHALDPDLLLWVYATLIDSLMFIHDEILPPLGDEKWERLYQEGRPFAYLFGIPDAALPPTLDDFRTYVRGMVNTVKVTDTARKMARAVIRSPHPVFGISNTILAAGTLPAPLREAFGLPWNGAVRAGYAAGMGVLRVIVPLLPTRLRTHTVHGKSDPISRFKGYFLKKYSS
ncbi:MAG: oxygenase MpaB family protein [Anaerolineales bacterium]